MKPTSRPERRALGLIAATRIGADVDFLVKLALGVTVGARYYHPALQRFIAEDPRIISTKQTSSEQFSRSDNEPARPLLHFRGHDLPREKPAVIVDVEG